jgi:hypothetical protein
VTLRSARRGFTAPAALLPPLPPPRAEIADAVII